MEAFLSAVSSVGFPVVSFFLMWKMCTDSIGKLTEAVNDMKEQNTNIMTTIKDMLRRD